MSKTLVTGGTGLVGYTLIRALLKRKRTIRVLVRSPDKARSMLPKNVEIVAGDITDLSSVQAAMEGCSHIFHAAGIPEQWLPDTKRFFDVNVTGTRNMVTAALDKHVQSFVFISTIDIFLAKTGERFDESRVDDSPKGTPSQRSKQEADRIVLDAFEHNNLPAIFIHPAAIYGPAPAGTPGVNNLIRDIANDAVPMLPPGILPVVFSEDLIHGCLSAEKRANPGERFIFCQSSLEFVDLGRAIAKEVGVTKPPKRIPLWFAQALANCFELISSVSGKAPLIHKGQLHYLQWRAIPISDKARKELDWQPVSLQEGIRRTAKYIFGEK